MRFLVHGQTRLPRRSGNYDGTGSHDVYREFEDRPSAERYAQELVELGNAWCASVEERPLPRLVVNNEETR